MDGVKAKHCARKVGLGGGLGKLLRQEVAYPRVSEFFYKAVAQAVLMYGSETWVLLVAMEKKVEGSHTGFLRQIMGRQAGRILDGTRDTHGAVEVQEAAVTQSVMTYIGIRKENVAQWVALRPMFKVLAGEKEYKGNGRRREAWCRQEATEKQLWETLAGVLREAKQRRIQVEGVAQ